MLVVALGFGVFELVSLRRLRRQREAGEQSSDDPVAK